jgi:dephospho-CoA kinase
MMNKLNSVVKQYLFDDFDKFIADYQDEAYVIVESAYFFEYKLTNFVDLMVGVDATLPIRLSRAQKRDHTSADNIIARIMTQMDQVKKMRLCDFVINNNETYDILEIEKLDRLFSKIHSIGLKMVAKTMFKSIS